jgi:hypothetical protein
MIIKIGDVYDERSTYSNPCDCHLVCDLLCFSEQRRELLPTELISAEASSKVANCCLEYAGSTYKLEDV